MLKIYDVNLNNFLYALFGFYPLLHSYYNTENFVNKKVIGNT